MSIEYTARIYDASVAYHSLALPSPPRVSGLWAALLTLPLLLCTLAPSSALRSRNPVHRSANDSLVVAGSAKKSVDSDGVLGVRWNGDVGSRKLLFAVPGLASPACSFCSSVQFRSAAINCRIWNFLGSDRSSARKCRKWLVTICLEKIRGVHRHVKGADLSILSSGLAFLRNLRAFVRWSLRTIASCRNFPIKRFFSFTSFSKGARRLSSVFID
jgi:hypothetical protein